jgi:hypothetical protein
VRRQAVGPTEPAQAPAQREAHHRRVGAAPGQRGEAVGLGRREQLAPLDAGADPSDPALGVDLDLGQGSGPDQDGVVERGGRAVAHRLRGDREPVPGGAAYGGDDVLVVGHRDHRRRPLLDREDPGGAGVLPARVTGRQDLAGEGRG